MQYLKRPKIQLLLIVIITFLVYSNIFKNQFLLDDFDFILNWQTAHGITKIPELLAGSVPPGHEGIYRPLRSIFYVISYQLWHTNTLGYHLQALFIHLICTVLVYFIAWEILKNQKLFAFIAALLFGLHPIHVEEVTYITASFDTIGIAFFFLAFYLYLKKRYGLSFFSALLAFFTYEITLILPLLLIFYEWSFRRKPFRYLSQQWKVYGIYSIGIGAYIFIRVGLVHIINRGEWVGGSLFTTGILMMKVFLKYLLLLFVPINLSIVHVLAGNIPTLGIPDIKQQMLTKSVLFGFDMWLGLFALIGSVFLVVYLRKKFSLLSFAIGWFLIALLPVSQLVPLQVLMGEKYLYIASFGFVLIISVILSPALSGRRISSRGRSFASLRMTILLLIVIFYGIVTFLRNADWQSGLTIWRDAAKKYPKSASAQYNSAVILTQNNKLEEAITFYELAINADASYEPALTNLGFVYLQIGNLPQALSMFKKAKVIKPDFYPIEYGLGMVYLKTGEVRKAREAFNRALQDNPSFLPAKEALLGIEL